MCYFNVKRKYTICCSYVLLIICHNNNLYLNLTSKSCGKKMNYMNANEKVCIVIANPNQWRSVIIYGIANIKDECDETANIEICVEKITGRKFYC